MQTRIRKQASKYSIKEKRPSIPPSTDRPSPHSAPTISPSNPPERDKRDCPKSNDKMQKTDGNDTKILYEAQSSEREPTSRYSQSSPSPSRISLEIIDHRNAVKSKPKSILVKRSVSEGPQNKGHGRESSQYRQSSLSDCHNPSSEKMSPTHSKKSFESMLSRPCMETGPLSGVQIQALLSAQPRLRIMNAKGNEEQDVAEAFHSSIEQAIPRRTVSFAPDTLGHRSSISERSYSTSSIHCPNVWFRAKLPRILQAGIRLETPELQGMSQDISARTPRQLALWDEGDLGTYVYEQDGHFDQPTGTAEGAQEQLSMLDKRMKQIASKSTRINHDVLGQATPGYVATMRRQQYANVYTSFRHSQHGLSRNSGESRCRSFLAWCDFPRDIALTQLQQFTVVNRIIEGLPCR